MNAKVDLESLQKTIADQRVLASAIARGIESLFYGRMARHRSAGLSAAKAAQAACDEMNRGPRGKDFQNSTTKSYTTLA